LQRTGYRRHSSGQARVTLDGQDGGADVSTLRSSNGRRTAYPGEAEGGRPSKPATPAIKPAKEEKPPKRKDKEK
jgi:hypothetical protein